MPTVRQARAMKLLVRVWTFLLAGVVAGEYVTSLTSKCVSRKDNRVTLSCPENHVIAQPIVFAGVGNDSTSCTPQEGDCTGLTVRLMTQRKKCFWKRWCELSWQSRYPIIDSERPECLGKFPAYVAVDSIVCVPQESVHSVWDNVLDLSRQEVGVIRSHDAYPWTYIGTQAGEHRKMLRGQPYKLLRVVVEDVDLMPDHGDRLVLTHVTSSHETVFFDASQSGRQEFLMTQGDVMIAFYVTGMMNASGRGFLLRYEYLSDVDVTSGEQGNPINVTSAMDIFLPSTRTRHASLEDCINRKEDRVTISCPKGHVIYKPEVTVGVSNHGYCRRMPSDCSGDLHTILTEKNNCYWQNRCQVTWTAGIPITLSRHPHCLAATPNYVSVDDHACVREDRVFNICDRKLSFINVTSGLIVSHVAYPWHYPSQKTVCRVRLPVHRTLGLRIVTDDIDLDPDSKADNVKVWQYRGKRKKLVRKAFRDNRLDVSFSQGCVEIEFRVAARTKAGRGFVLKFGTTSLSTTPASSDFYDCPSGKKSGRGRRQRGKGKKRRGRYRENRRSKKNRKSIRRTKKDNKKRLRKKNFSRN